MIFVTTGSQKFQFNRLLIYIDELIEEGILKEKVFAQIGYCTYLPRNFEYTDFLDRDEFKKKVNISNMIITHAGTGAIISAVKESRKTIAVPRDCQFDEHVDNHQYEIAENFERMNYILLATNKVSLQNNIEKVATFKPRKFISNTEKYIEFFNDLCR